MWHYPFISKNWPWCSRSFLVQPKTFKSVFWCAIEINHSNLSIYGSISEILYNYKDVFIKGRTYKWTGLICLTIFVQEYVHVLVKFCPAALLLIPTSKPTGFLSVTLHDGMYLIKISWVLIIARYGEYLEIPLFHKMTCLCYPCTGLCRGDPLFQHALGEWYWKEEKNAYPVPIR